MSAWSQSQYFDARKEIAATEWKAREPHTSPRFSQPPKITLTERVNDHTAERAAVCLFCRVFLFARSTHSLVHCERRVHRFAIQLKAQSPPLLSLSHLRQPSTTPSTPFSLPLTTSILRRREARRYGWRITRIKKGSVVTASYQPAQLSSAVYATDANLAPLRLPLRYSIQQVNQSRTILHVRDRW